MLTVKLNRKAGSELPEWQPDWRKKESQTQDTNVRIGCRVWRMKEEWYDYFEVHNMRE